ncbi:MAG: YihY/virulence factor BrkB family protein [Ruminococcaceae bacterium]|nr:YihY/virulence factor BrkB family protein [Oscillospiraceae bacterium]
MVRRYLRHRVATQSAALAFYLLFTLFPFLIFISALLGTLQLDVAAILASLDDFLPRQVVDFAERYLIHVGENSSVRLLVFGLVFSVYFPMRATNSLLRAVRTAYHLGPPRSIVRHWVRTFVYTILLIVAIALTLTLLTVSDRALVYAVNHLRLPLFAAQLWGRLRFPLIGVVGFFALFFLYAAAQDARQPWRNIWPGSLMALAGWLGLSWMYAWYVENIAHYSVFYGSIGTVIVLMIWLNLSAAALILGAELNGTIMSMRKDRLLAEP